MISHSCVIHLFYNSNDSMIYSTLETQQENKKCWLGGKPIYYSGGYLYNNTGYVVVEANIEVDIPQKTIYFNTCDENFRFYYTILKKIEEIIFDKLLYGTE